MGRKINVLNSDKTISPAQLEYLKAIYFITRKCDHARTKQIAEFLGVSNAAVSGTLPMLADKGYVSYAPYEMITLTRKGITTARKSLHRQRALYEFFSGVLEMEDRDAYDTAKGMETAVSKELEERLLHFVHFYRTEVLHQLTTGIDFSCSGRRTCEQCKRQIEKIS